jgi:8-oxo-dGTP diphosphatase
MKRQLSYNSPEQFNPDAYLPQLSLDCVVFGFHDNQLKVLLLKLAYDDTWSLPGGHVLREESLEEAASRVLYDRTGLKDLFLRGFGVFSDPERVKNKFPEKTFLQSGFSRKSVEWLSQRFVTVGFYALVDYSRVLASRDMYSENCTWKEIDNAGELMMDHNLILDKALITLRHQLNYEPIGMNLLPEKFTMPELQKLYETILGKKLDRRNFKRKIDSYNIITDTGETKPNCAHKAPFLYQFDIDKYQKALKDGLSGRW